MSDSTQASDFRFPKWANWLLPILLIGGGGGAVYVPTLAFFTLSPRTLNVGYMPEQPVPYSHALHVGELGMDCRYCHNTVDQAAFAAVPSTATCMNCHANIKPNSPKLKAVRESWETGEPIEWVKVHDLADYSYFDHSAHVNKGVSCVSCHGRVDKMGEEGVWQVERLSMGWCIECHRQPEDYLRPVEHVYDLDWKPEVREGETLAMAQRRVGLEQKEKMRIHDEAYMTACSTCHR